VQEGRGRSRQIALAPGAQPDTFQIMTRPSIELSLRIFIVVLVVTFVWTMVRVLGLVGWL
jgi:hypothetical protein